MVVLSRWSLLGVVELMWWRLQLWWRPRVIALLSDWLIVVDHGGWRCLATASAAWDCVGGRRLQQQHRVMTRLAADYDEWLNIAELLQCGTLSEDGASNFFGYCFSNERYLRGWSNEVKSACGGGLGVRWGPWEMGQHCPPV